MIKMLKLDKSKKYLLACSFGPDSMALLSMLQTEGFDFDVAHVNYNLREESLIEKESLIKYCGENSINLFIEEIEKDSITGNLENKCRKIRYSFFRDLFKSGNYESLLVAHHEDDHIETYLLQKDRKNIVSYYGLSPKRNLFGMSVERPLLSVSKSDILEYCKNNNVSYSIDKTNLENTYKRNKIRHNIVEKFNKQERETILLEIAKNNKKIQELKENLKKINLNYVKNIVNLDDFSFAIALHLELEKISNGDVEKTSISRKFANEIKKALLSDIPNISFSINKDISFVKNYDECGFKRTEENKPYSYTLSGPGKLETEYFTLDFTGDTKNRNVSLKDYPLTIRNAKLNDRFDVKDYKTSIRRAFIDWKMPKEIRAYWPVIENKDGKIIYVPRYRKNFVPKPNDNFFVKIK